MDTAEVMGAKVLSVCWGAKDVSASTLFTYLDSDSLRNLIYFESIGSCHRGIRILVEESGKCMNWGLFCDCLVGPGNP